MTRTKRDQGTPFPMPTRPFLNAIDEMREGHTDSRFFLCMGKKLIGKDSEKVLQNYACVEWICLLLYLFIILHAKYNNFFFFLAEWS